MMNSRQKYLEGILVDISDYGYGIMDENYIIHFLDEYQFFEIYINSSWEYASVVILPYEGWAIILDNKEIHINIVGLPIRMGLDSTNDNIDTDFSFLI